MSSTNNSVEWVETTEEVVVTEECPPENSTFVGKILGEVLVDFNWWFGMFSFKMIKLLFQ